MPLSYLDNITATRKHHVKQIYEHPHTCSPNTLDSSDFGSSAESDPVSSWRGDQPGIEGIARSLQAGLDKTST